MSKKITVVIGKNGKMLVDYSGYSGDECFEEAKKLKAHLKALGLELEDEAAERKPPEIPEMEGETKHSSAPKRTKKKQGAGK